MKGGYIRWLIRNDLERVIEIEKASFEYPWNRTDFVGALGQRNCIGNVYELNGEVEGYMIYVLHRHTLEVLNLAVDEKYRRSGVAGEMIARLVGKLEYQKRFKIAAQVRDRNLVAQCFLRSMDFKAVGVKREWYEDSKEDAYDFEYIHKVGVSRDALSRCGGR